MRKINQQTKTTKIASDDMVVGDLVLLKAGDEFLADMVLLEGSCLVSEAILTGEAGTLLKTGLLQNDENNEKYIIEPKQKLHCGTECIALKSKRAMAVVTRTGWNTSKGDLISDIIHSKHKKQKFYNEVYKLFFIMFVISIIIVLGLFIKLQQYIFKFSDYVYISLQIVTFSVPLPLLAAITVGVNIADSRLRKNDVFPVMIEKINEVGVSKEICFDKTGTLTESAVKASGYVVSNNASLSSFHKSLLSARNLPGLYHYIIAMGCCH